MLLSPAVLGWLTDLLGGEGKCGIALAREQQANCDGPKKRKTGRSEEEEMKLKS